MSRFVSEKIIQRFEDGRFSLLLQREVSYLIGCNRSLYRTLGIRAK